MKKHTSIQVFLALTVAICFVSLQPVSASNFLPGTEVPEHGPGLSKVMEKDATNGKVFYIHNDTESAELPIVRIYNADHKLVVYQTWNGNYTEKKYKMTVPERLPSGTYEAEISFGKETYKQTLTW